MTEENTKRHEYDWSYLVNAAERAYGPECCDITDDNSQVFLYIGDLLHAIFQKRAEHADVTFHVRASIPPNAAIKLHDKFMKEGIQATIGDVFEIHHKSGEILHGVQALRYVANHIHLVWFGEQHPLLKKAHEFLQREKLGLNASPGSDAQSKFEQDITPPKKELLN